MFPQVGIEFFFDRAKHHEGDFLYTSPHCLYLLFGHVLAQLAERQLVPVLELAITKRVLLHCVICQMDEVVRDVISAVGLCRCADIPFTKKVKFQLISQ